MKNFCVEIFSFPSARLNTHFAQGFIALSHLSLHSFPFKREE